MTVLEVGSRDVNGNPRHLFLKRGCQYIGVDIEPGKNVDRLNFPGHPLPFPDGEFDVVISSSTFEHDPAFWVTIREMARVTKLDGTVFVTAPSTGPYHAHPGDNWRFMFDASYALAYWCSKTLDGNAYPLRVVGQRFIDEDRIMRSNAMTFTRTSIPQTSFVGAA